MARKAKAKRTVPLPDPPPQIIADLLRVKALLENDPAAGTDPKAEIFAILDFYLRPWKKAEDLAELRELLGVAGDQKRRKHRTVNRELDLALAYAELLERGDPKARDTVAEAHNVSVKAVSRAWANWAEHATAAVFVVRNMGGGKINLREFAIRLASDDGSRGALTIRDES